MRTAFICVRKCKGPDSDGPPSLSPGDQYRLGFVTSEGISATSPNIGDYNIFAQSIAEAVPELAALGADWSAVASTESVNARENTGTDPLTDGPGIPIFLIDGSKIADDNSDLWDGDIDTAFNLREDEVIVQGGVWTGSNASGDPASALGQGSTVTQGGPSNLGPAWMENTRNDNFRELPLYVLSSPLTVVPEPHSMALALLFCFFATSSRLRNRD